jgi:hypothetical protein
MLLQDQIIPSIFKHLPFKNLIYQLCVSKQFRRLACDAILPILLDSTLYEFQEQIEICFKIGIWLPTELRNKISDSSRNQIILKMACKYCISSEIVPCISRGADVNKPDEKHGHYPVHTVCIGGASRDCIKTLILLLREADLNAYEVSPLSLLCPGLYARYNISMLKLLLEDGICVNGNRENWRTPLSIVLSSDNSPSKMTPIVDLLLDYNADVENDDITVAIKKKYDDILILRLIEQEKITSEMRAKQTNETQK